MADGVRATKGRGAGTAAAGRGHTSEGKTRGAYRGHAKTGRRQARVNVSLTDDELAAVRAAAAEAGQTPSTWLAETGVRVAARASRGRDREAFPAGEVRAIELREAMVVLGRTRAQLAAIGNNVNQIAKAVNAGQPLESAQAQSVWTYIRDNVGRLDVELVALREALDR